MLYNEANGVSKDDVGNDDLFACDCDSCVTQTRNIYHHNLLTQTDLSDSLYSGAYLELSQCNYQ